MMLTGNTDIVFIYSKENMNVDVKFRVILSTFRIIHSQLQLLQNTSANL